jgi:Tat protein secretion system quality control protein TatD with DNase activity
VNKPEKWDSAKATCTCVRPAPHANPGDLQGVKGRNEPNAIIQVLECICGSRGLEPEPTAEILYSNTTKVFFP